MSLAYFDDTARLRIKCGPSFAVRDVPRVKVDFTTGGEEDRATLYIPLSGVRDARYVSPSDWDEEAPPSDGFTVRPGDGFTFENTGRNGAPAVSSPGIFEITSVTVYTRGSRRMRHIKATGVRRDT
ncbi:MAG: hypothetical protein J5830_00535 [Clostridia bacterium]|nr:hypothetical protein [Clostridia bacterium]